MAKFYGKIGFVIPVEDPPESGVIVNKQIERSYYGDIIRNYRRWEHSQQVNDDINVNNEISIVADPYVNMNTPYIRYVIWNDVKWKVTGIDVLYPRMVLSIGGVYNA